MTTPTLKTGRLTLSFPLLHKNISLEHYIKWLGDPEVVRFSEQRHLSHTRLSQFNYLQSYVGTPHHFWEITVARNPIGSISAYRNLNNGTANLGIMIGEKRLWGEGYGPEAWEGACEWLFSDGVRKIEAGCMASNIPMQRILAKNGFSWEARIPGHFLLNGKPEDVMCYGKTAKVKVISFNSKSAA